MIYPQVSASVGTNRFWLWFINDCCAADLSNHLRCCIHIELLFIHRLAAFRFTVLKHCGAALHPPTPSQFSFLSLSLVAEPAPMALL